MHFEGLRGFDVTGKLPEVACPVLVIGSKDDMVLGPSASARIAEYLNGRKEPALLHMYDGCGHAAYDTAPDYRERLLQFFSS